MKNGMNFISLVAAPIRNDNFPCSAVRSNKIAKSPSSEAGAIMTQFPLASWNVQFWKNMQVLEVILLWNAELWNGVHGKNCLSFDLMMKVNDPSDIKFALELGHKHPYLLFMDYIKVLFWFTLELLSETFLILRRIQRDMIINVHRSSCKVPAILVRLKNLDFLDRFSKNPQMSHVIKIFPVGAGMLHAKGRAGR
jgi:hypothetical protein